VTETKGHPIAGFIFAIVLAVLALLLLGTLNTLESALIAAPFLIGWAVLSVAIFGPARH
jgi:hypothetical protein